jgi:predicted LPLAT superfamily acyltransferase/plasmid maintenance system antidote protein VapI
MILRFCIAIPTYNNPLTIVSVVEDCLRQTKFPIVVIDDGSTEPVLQLLQNPRVQVITHPRNLGKGTAIQTAFKFALENDFTHLLMMDGDGQHLASEILKMITASLESPWDLILGNRKLTAETVPKISKFGRKFSNFWVKFETETDVKDSQSGFRVYPIFQVQNMKFFTSRFDFEIEVLIRLIWQGVDIKEVEIECHYPTPEDRVSHFHKVRDNIRISLLNAVLVVLSLLRRPQSSFKAASAFAIGVMVGTTPLFGFHTLIVGGISVLFRLNFVFLLLGTQISLPFIAPVLIVAALKIAKVFGFSWWMGFASLALILGSLGFVLCWSLMETLKAQRSEKKQAWSGKTRGGKFGNAFMKTVTKYGGLKSAYFFLYFLVPYFYFFAPTARRGLNQYWLTLSPGMRFFPRQFKILAHFNQYARILVDRAFQQFKSEPVFQVNSHGSENILKTIEKNLGVVMVTAHVGGWYLAAMTLKQRSGHTFKVVQFEADGLTYEKVIGKKEGQGIAKSIFDIRELLQQGLPVGFMADRPLSKHVELVRVFGKFAVLDASPFRIAAICKVPILFSLGVKGKHQTYQFYASAAREYSSSEILLGLTDYAKNLEQILHKYPNQWFNFFSFWSLRGFGTTQNSLQDR